MNRMTDRCKNITLATTSLRPVKIKNLKNNDSMSGPISKDVPSIIFNVSTSVLFM